MNTVKLIAFKLLYSRAGWIINICVSFLIALLTTQLAKLGVTLDPEFEASIVSTLTLGLAWGISEVMKQLQGNQVERLQATVGTVVDRWIGEKTVTDAIQWVPNEGAEKVKQAAFEKLAEKIRGGEEDPNQVLEKLGAFANGIFRG